MHDDCPRRQALTEFNLGTLDEVSASEVAEHLETCEACQDTVHEIEQQEDLVIVGLKLPKQPDSFSNEPQLQQAIRKAGESLSQSKDETRAAEVTWALGHALETPNDLARCVVVSQLMTAAQIREFHRSLPLPDRPEDAQQFATLLFEADLLTQFQVDHLLAGEPQVLVLGEYTLIDRIGSGGMGDVYKALHRRMERVVAIKLLRAEMTPSAASVERFQQEAKAAARLAHPNIVTAYDASESAGRHYLVMEYVPGENLSVLVQNRGQLPFDEAVNYVLQTARGLLYAHEQGVIHRDIKPANLLVDHQGAVKILDMGLARLQKLGNRTGDDGQPLTLSGEIMGTVDYMSPEQAEDMRAVDHRTDIYSLGCTLYRLLSGEVPYPGESLMHKLLQHRDGPVPSLRAARPDVPAELEQVYQQMVAKSPDDRPADMAQVIQLLAACDLSSVSPGGTSASSPSIQTQSWFAPENANAGQKRFRLPRKIAISAALIGVGLAVMVAIVIRGSKGSFEIKIDPRYADDVSVEILKNGELVQVASASEGWNLRLAAGDYDLQLKGNDEFKINKNRIQVRRGENVAVTIIHDAIPTTVDTATPVALSDPTQHARPAGEMVLVGRFEGHTKRPRRVQIAPNGKFAVSMANDQTILWDLEKRELKRTFSGNVFSGMFALDISPDSRTVALGGDEGIWLWESETGDSVKQFDLPEKYKVRSLAYSPDGLRLAIGIVGRPVAIWDIASNKQLDIALDGLIQSDDLSFSPDGRFLLSMSTHHGGLKIVNVQTGEVVVEEWALARGGFRAVWSRDGKTVAVVGNNAAQVYSLESKRVIQSLSVGEQLRGVCFAASGNHLLTASGRLLQLWDVKSGKVIARAETETPCSKELDVSPDGKYVFVSGGFVQEPGTDQSAEEGNFDLRLWQLPESEWPAAEPSAGTLTPIRSFVGHTGPVKSVVFSRDGKLAASGSGWPPNLSDNTARVWDVASGKELHVLRRHQAHVMSVAFAPSGKSLVSGDAEGDVYEWNAETGEFIRQFAKGSMRIEEIAYTPNGKYVVAGMGVSNCVEVWNAQGELLHTRPQKHQVKGIAVTPDSRYVAIGRADGTVNLEVIETGELVRQFTGPDIRTAYRGPYDVAISPDGARLAGVFQDSNLRVWNLQSAQTIADLKFASYGAEVVVFSADGRHVVVGGRVYLSLFDLETNHATHEDLLDGCGWAAAVSPDGKSLLTGGGAVYIDDDFRPTGNYTLRLWQLPQSVWPNNSN